MLYILNYALYDLASKEAQFYFLLCMRGDQRLGRYLPLAGGIVQSLFAMAIHMGAIVPEDARRLFEEIRSDNAQTMKFLSTYPVDLTHTSADPEAATVERLAWEFDNILTKDAVELSQEDQISQSWKGNVDLLFTTLGQPENDEHGQSVEN